MLLRQRRHRPEVRFRIALPYFPFGLAQLNAPTKKNELNEISPAEAGVNSFNSFNSYPPAEWRAGVERLRMMLAPESIALSHWRQIVADAGRFLAAWGGTAAALGWSTLDLFGVHRRKPMARYDVAGLMILLDGAEVVALTADSAEIRTRSGALQRYRRTLQPKPEAVTLWDLP